MKFQVLFRLLVLAVFPVFLSGCYYAIPTIVEAVNQNRIQNESEGAILESNTGALKLIAQNDTLATDKMNAYIQGYNSVMVGSWSLWPSYHTFINHTLKSKPADTIPFPVVNDLEKGIAFMKKGLACDQATIPGLDEAITESVAAAEKLRRDEQTSLPYFQNQIYRRDNMAGARQVFPILQEDYEKLIAAMNRTGKLLADMQKTETERRMAAYRAQKSMIGYHTEKSLLYAQELIALFNRPENSVSRPENYIEGDRLIAEMEKALQTQRKILDDVYPLRDRSGGLDAINDSLTEMSECYRKMKKKKTARSFNRMMKRYSDAIGNYNHSLTFTRPL